MISTYVPAQITSVEDKIAGNLNLTQVILLVLPVGLSAMLIVLFPPNLKIVFYKIPIALLVGLLTITLAIRFRGELILSRIIKLISFYKRPSVYLSSIRPLCQCYEKSLPNEDETCTPSVINEPSVCHPVAPADFLVVDDCMSKKGKGFIADKEGNISAIISITT